MLRNSSKTKCPKCEATNFEAIPDIPSKIETPLIYLRCSKCKTFLQALPTENTNWLIKKLAEKLKLGQLK